MVQTQYFAVPLELTPAQIRKLVKGMSIQIPHARLMKGVELVLKKKKATRVSRSHTKGKGVRLQLDPDELEMSGGALLDVLKKAGRFIKEKVFTNPTYKQAVAPLIKKGLQSGVSALQAIAGTRAPMLAPLIGDVGSAAVNRLGEVSGAYGIKLPKYGSALNPHVPIRDTSAPSWEMVEQEEQATQARRGRLVKGSAEAKEWGAKMRAMRAARGGSFRMS